MAAFQLAGLPSMQISNQTAGGLGLPAVPQYAERPNTGVMLAQGIGSIYDNLQAREKQQSEADFMKSFGAAYAANDRDAMKQLAVAHPEQIERIQKGMGFIDQDRNQVIGQAAMDLRLAAKSGDQSLMSSLQKNAPILNQMGLSPEEAFLSYKQDPKQFDQMTDLIGMHALGPEKYFDIQDKQEGRDIDRGKLAETERSNRAGESLTMRSQNISAQNAALDREIKRAELENKKLDRQAQNSTNELRKQALEQQIAANQQKIDEATEKNVSPD
ncbi:phage DNA ejection protein [Candidatus Arsenophonus triatominarum]|uniref:phage DNA ejection protein n=1 Tax=Candidatus Arsenophonus triatominarum TaxID=57911 RepID=UPI0007C5D090|nr:phage DNA ejection protein [Candidatus Arsenophonus triatominarum]